MVGVTTDMSINTQLIMPLTPVSPIESEEARPPTDSQDSHPPPPTFPAPPRAPAKPPGSKPPRPASSSTSSSGPPGKALTEQELEAQLGDDTYMRALMAKKDAKRAKNVPSANAPPAGGGGVAAFMELTLHKPEKSSVVGVQCEPAPGGEGVLIVAMSQKARGR